MQKDISVVILAAGKGERMKSGLPKVLHSVCGRPMVGYVLEISKELKPRETILVLGHKHELVTKHVKLERGLKKVIQRRLNGTGGAVKDALHKVRSGNNGIILVLYGDNPLIKKETVVKLLRYHRDNELDATLLTSVLDNPHGYGRILRDKYNNISGIIEEKDADDLQKAIKEVNTGIACFNKKALSSALKHVKPNNSKKEYYLTDVIEVLYKNGGLVGNIKLSDINEAIGINSRMDLSRANSIMRERINERLMLGGVTIVDPKTTFIDYDTKIGQDTVIYPFTVIERNVRIGKHCAIGPFAHLRDGVELGDEITAGNFIEIVRSRLGRGIFVKHFSYLGDTIAGNNVNIGAGVVTANFDGKEKRRTIIKDKAFVGSDTVLVAPVKIGKQAKTGAGSVVLNNVPDKTTVVGVPAVQIKRRGKHG